MTQAALLALLLAGPPVLPVTIYVGPVLRDGFVEMDGGVRDSIKDLKNALRWKLRPDRKNAPFRLVDDPQTADVKLYVVGRDTAAGSDTTTVGTVVGTTTIVGSSRKNIHRLETRLIAGRYERPFVWEGGGGWGSLADGVAKDVAAWLTANRERILDKQ